MNNLRNHVILIGNLGSDVHLKQLDNGNAVANVSLATNENYKRNDEWVRETQWHRLVVWGKTAERFARQAGKGSEVAVQGKLKYKLYTDKEGNRRQIAEILVNEFMVTSGSRPATPSGDAAPPAAASGASAAAKAS